MDSTESQLIVRCQNGDKRAFETLVKQYQRKVFGIAYGIVRNQQDALDISQEAFLRAYKSLPGFKGDSTFYTWIYRITVNLAIDSVNQRKKHAAAPHDDTRQLDDSDCEWSTFQQTGGNPARDLENKELATCINACMERLSEIHRTALVLRELEGLSYDEMAEAMNCNIGTVMSRLFHARQKMKRLMRVYLHGEDE